MATTLSKNLKLRIDSNLTANAKYNLSRIDLLGGTFLTDSTNTLNIRSQTDINIEPNSADVGGSGTGGNVYLGTANHKLASLEINTNSLEINGPLSLADQAVGGTTSLALKYKSDIDGAVDTSDRTLSIDVNGADRNLVLGGDLQLLGGNLVLSLSGPTSLVLPTSGTLSTLSGAETLTNKTLSAASNTITGLTNASISNTAAISYSKLALTGSVTNSDISPTAAITYNKLSLTDGITNTDINSSAAIAYSKLNLVGSITNGDIAAAAGIQYSKLQLTGSIQNADISASAAIARSKLASGSADVVLINNGSGQMAETAVLPTSLGGTGVSSSATFPTSGTILSNSNTATVTNKSIDGGSNTLSNIPRSALLLTGELVDADISASAAIAYSKLALSASITNADISSSAAIAGTKISPDFGNQTIRTLDKLEFEEGGYKTSIAAASGGQSQDLAFQLPNNYGTNGQVLQTNGSGSMDWITVGGTGTVTSVDLSAPGEFTVSGNPITGAGTLTLTKANQAANQVWAGPTTGSPAQPSFRSLVLADLPSGSVKSYAYTWSTADGTTKVIAHNLGTTQLDVSFIDLSDNTRIGIGSVVFTDNNTLTLIASEAPSASGWAILIQG